MSANVISETLNLLFPGAPSVVGIGATESTIPLNYDKFDILMDITPLPTGDATLTFQTYDEVLDLWVDFWSYTVANGASAYTVLACFPSNTWSLGTPVGYGDTPALAAGLPCATHPRRKMRAVVSMPDTAGEPLLGAPVRAASTGNVANLASVPVVQDDVTLVQNDRILLKDQTTQSQNGVYVVGIVAAGNAPLTRATDMDSSGECLTGFTFSVQEGTANGGKYFALGTPQPITLNTTSLVFNEQTDGVGRASITVIGYLNSRTTRTQ